MKNLIKLEALEWTKAIVFAAIIWSCFLGGLAASTRIHEWHLAEKNTCTVVATTIQDNK
ncbi:MAG: hypothetical protein ACI3T9_02255 [Romboutsia timonensis]